MGQRTGRVAVLGTMLTASVLFLGHTAAWAQGIVLNMVTADAGQQVAVTATLATGGGMVAGTQNDFAFDPANIPVVRKTNGRPDCTVNPAIEKPGTSFAFQPAGCTGAACVRVRALVLATDNTDAIPNGSLLYTCKVDVAASAAGSFPLTLSGTILSNPTGMRVCGTGATDPPCSGNVNGQITVGGGGPTPTPTSAPVVGPGIELPTVQGHKGAMVAISAVLSTNGGMVAGTQNDFSFDPVNIPVVRKSNGRPDCAVNPAIEKPGTSFAFQPAGCTAEACVRVRALVLATDNTDPIPDGSVLYTCNIAVAMNAPDGRYPLTLSGTILSNPTGQRVCGTGATDPPCTGNVNGAVEIGIVGPTNTPTATPIQPTGTATSAASATPTTGVATPTRTATSGGGTPTPSGQALLSSNITATDLAIPVSNVTAFPNAGTVKINNELITYTGITRGTGVSGILTGAGRGASGTTAAAHVAGSLVTLSTGPQPPLPQNDDDACSCRTTTNPSQRNAWMVLIPAIGLLILRRRSR